MIEQERPICQSSAHQALVERLRRSQIRQDRVVIIVLSLFLIAALLLLAVSLLLAASLWVSIAIAAVVLVLIVLLIYNLAVRTPQPDNAEMTSLLSYDSEDDEADA